MNQVSFDISKWQLETVQIIGAYQALERLLSSSDSLQYHISRLPFLSWDKDGNTGSGVFTQLPEEHQAGFSDLLFTSFESAREVYNRQMVVLAATYTEVISDDFLYCLFISYPERMYDYIDEDQSKFNKGKVDLKDILKESSKESLIRALARRSTSIAMRGKFSKVAKVIENVSKCRLDSTLVRNLSEVVEQRNRIVHEAVKDEITSERVHEAFDLIEQFLKFLGKIAHQIGIPFNDHGFLILGFDSQPDLAEIDQLPPAIDRQDIEFSTN